ncbi:MAG: YesL family protein [Clostridiales bacterium]|nr:YesL family protein [Clostridiales bacterium]
MYLAWLNFLWLLCSLPILTIGASTTAVYYTAMRMARDDEGYIATRYTYDDTGKWNQVEEWGFDEYPICRCNCIY